jgi:tRNA(Glu) U13 pseudouridine synthase TruD
MTREQINDKRFALYREMKIFWLQRPWRVFPQSASFRWEKDDLILQFTLPWGSYASVMIGM